MLVGDNEKAQKVLKALQVATQPVSIQWVAWKTGLHWQVTRAILFELLASKIITGMKTSKSWIFWLPSNVPSILGRHP